MNIEISGEQITAALSAVAGAVTATSILWVKIVKPMRALIDRAEVFWSDWAGVQDRPGVPGRKGVMERISAIEHELTTNGGGSLRDAVSRTEARAIRLERVVDQAQIIAFPPPSLPPTPGETASPPHPNRSNAA